jgi:CO/xanthine dehydrogenase Mo-binding subunit
MCVFRLRTTSPATKLPERNASSGTSIKTYNSMSVGEPVIMPTAAAIANAVGVRIKSLPITAEKILAALKSGKR